MEIKTPFIKQFKEQLDEIKVSEIQKNYSLLEEVREIKHYLEEFIETIKKPKGLIEGFELKIKRKDGTTY